MQWARFLKNHFLETCELSQQIAMEIEKERNISLGTKNMIWQYTFMLSQGKEKEKSLLQDSQYFCGSCTSWQNIWSAWAPRRGDTAGKGSRWILTQKYYNTLLQMCYRKPSDLQFCPPSAPSLSWREHTLELTHQNETPRKSKQNVNREKKNSKFSVTVRKRLGFLSKSCWSLQLYLNISI